MIVDVNAYLGHFAFRQLRHNTASALLRLMDRKGIDRAVVSSAASITYRDAHSGNEELAAEIEGRRDRLVPFAVLNPAYAGWREDLEECRRLGFKGLRLYPGWHNYKLADPACRELVHAAAEYSLPVSIPLRVEDRRQQSWLVDIPDVDKAEIAMLVQAVPSAKFILMNGSGYLGSPLGKKDSGLPANFVIEISLLTALLGNELGQLIANLGAERVVFGTGMPFHYPDVALTKLEALEAAAEVKESIRWKNSVEGLKL